MVYGWVLRLDSKVGSQGWSQGWVPRLGPKVGSQGWDPRLGPKFRSQGWSQGWIPRLCSTVGSHCFSQSFSTKVGSYGRVPRLSPYVGSQGQFPWLGVNVNLVQRLCPRVWYQGWVPLLDTQEVFRLDFKVWFQG